MMLRSRFIMKSNLAILEIWADAASSWGRPQAARMSHLVAAELYGANGDAAILEVKKNARTGISRVLIHPGGFFDLSSPVLARHTRTCVVAAVRSAESIAKMSIRMDLHPASSETSGAQK